MYLHISPEVFINLDKVAELDVTKYSTDGAVELLVYYEADFSPYDEVRSRYPTLYPLIGYKSVNDAKHALCLAFEGFFNKSDKLAKFPVCGEYYGTFNHVPDNKGGL